MILKESAASKRFGKFGKRKTKEKGEISAGSNRCKRCKFGCVVIEILVEHDEKQFKLKTVVRENCYKQRANKEDIRTCIKFRKF